MSEDELVVVYEANDNLDAAMFRAVLEDAGIQVLEHPLEYQWLEYHNMLGRGHSQLLVKVTDAPRAHQLLLEYQQQVESDTLSPDESEDEE